MTVPNTIQRLCVFCGSSLGADPAYAQAARDLGGFLAVHSITLVYGGGRVGLMGTLADAVLAADGEVIGVIPEALVAKEVAHQKLTTLHVVSSMHERKALMAELADAFVALPGGCGTLEEFFEILTWAQLGIHQKPCAVLNVCGYFDGMLALLDHALAERFVRPEHRQMIIVASDPAQLLQSIANYRAPDVPKWIDLPQS